MVRSCILPSAQIDPLRTACYPHARFRTGLALTLQGGRNEDHDSSDAAEGVEALSRVHEGGGGIEGDGSLFASRNTDIIAKRRWAIERLLMSRSD